MFSVDDTIVAIATPSGRGGIGIVRLSGLGASRVACALMGRSGPLRPRHATFGTIGVAGPDAGHPLPQDQSQPAARPGLVRDQVIVTYFPQPQSYTGDDVVEISAHGSPVVLQTILRSALDAGARLAEPGEFTLRAFLNGKLDLVQAEAVADLINSVTPLQARVAFDQLEGTLTTVIGEIEAALFDLIARLEASLDFPDEGYHFVQRDAAAMELRGIAQRMDALLANAARGRLIREGAQIAIVGTPNVGKSSLFNALLNANRAIVTPVPGTTRDLLTERADIGGLSVSLVDTAGIRESQDVVEQEGVERARGAAGVADLTMLVLDRSRSVSADDVRLMTATAERPRLIVINKVDLPMSWTPETLPGVADGLRRELLDAPQVSVKTGTGMNQVVDRVATALVAPRVTRDEPIVTNVRHRSLLEQSRLGVRRAIDALAASDNDLSEEFVLADIQDAAGHLQEITGRRTTEDLLAHIFKNFCVGK